MVVDVVNHLIAASVTTKRSTESGASSAFDVQDKLRKAVRSFQAGLAKNAFLTRTDFLQLAYGVLSGRHHQIKIDFSWLVYQVPFDDFSINCLHRTQLENAAKS